MKTYTQEEVDEMLKEQMDKIVQLENYIVSLQNGSGRKSQMTQEDWDQLEEERQFNFEQFG